MGSRVTFRREHRGEGLEIALDGEVVGRVMSAEDRTGTFYAWSAFHRGQFGGSASRADHRLATLDEAKKAAADWLRHNLERDSTECQQGTPSRGR